MKGLKTVYAARVSGFAVTAICAVLLFGGASRAAEVPGAYQPSALMLVEGKARDRIFASKQFYRVTRETEVFDAEGKQLSLQALPVPCRAKVRYVPARAGQMPEALRIVITEVLQGATTAWKMPAPE
jgi:hypothetical protein